MPFTIFVSIWITNARHKQTNKQTNITEVHTMEDEHRRVAEVVVRKLLASPSHLVAHHVDSYNHFVEVDLASIFLADNRIELNSTFFEEGVEGVERVERVERVEESQLGGTSSDKTHDEIERLFQSYGHDMGKKHADAQDEQDEEEGRG